MSEGKGNRNFTKTLDGIIQGGLIFLLIFTPLVFGAVHTWSIAVMSAATLVVFLSWLFKMAAQKELRWLKTPLNLPAILIIAFLLFQVLPLSPRALQRVSPEASRIYSETIPGYGELLKENPSDQGAGLRGNSAQEPPSRYDTRRTLSIYKWATWSDLKLVFVYLVALFAFMNNVSTERQLRRMVLVIVAVGFGIALLGILQKLSGAQAIYWFWTTPSWIGRTPGFFGTFVNRNNFAGYMVMSLPLTFGLLWGIRRHRLSEKGKGERSESEWMEEGEAGIQKGLLGFFAFIMVIALFMSLSRGGMLSFMFVMLVMAAVMGLRRRAHRRGRLAWLMAAVALAVLVIISSPSVHERLATLANLEEDYSALYRMDVWKDTWKMIQDSPFVGTGLGTFQYIFPKYRVHSATNMFYWDHAHNDYLEAWSDIGLIGLLLCLWALYRLFKDVLFCHTLGVVRGVAHKSKNMKAHKRRDMSAIALAVGALGGMTGILVHSTVDFNLHIPGNALLFALLAGIAVIAIHLRHDPEGDYLNMRRMSVRLPRWGRYALFPTLAVLGIYLFWWPIMGPFRAELLLKKATAMRLPKEVSGENPILELFKNAATLDPGNAEHLIRLGEYQRSMMSRFWGKDQYKYAYFREMAENSFHRAINLNPTRGIYHTRQGWVQNDFQRVEAAAREFSLGVKYEPASAYPHWSYGNWALKTAARDPTFLEVGVQEYKKAIAIRPFIAREALQRYSRFARNYDELKEVIPSTKEAHKELARFLQQENMWEKNRQAFKRHMLQTADSALYYLTQAHMDHGKGKHKEAIETLLEFLEVDGNNAEAHFWLALFADQHGKKVGYDWEFSKKHFVEAIRIDPISTFYRKWYGRHLYYHREYQESARQLTVALRRDKGPFVYYMLGDAYKALGDVDKAALFYQRAIEKAPDNLQYVLRLAMLYYNDGRYHKAREQFSRILELEPNHTEALNYLKKIERDIKSYLSQRAQ